MNGFRKQRNIYNVFGWKVLFEHYIIFLLRVSCVFHMGFNTGVKLNEKYVQRPLCIYFSFISFTRPINEKKNQVVFLAFFYLKKVRGKPFNAGLIIMNSFVLRWLPAWWSESRLTDC